MLVVARILSESGFLALGNDSCQEDGYANKRQIVHHLIGLHTWVCTHPRPVFLGPRGVVIQFQFWSVAVVCDGYQRWHHLGYSQLQRLHVAIVVGRCTCNATETQNGGKHQKALLHIHLISSFIIRMEYCHLLFVVFATFDRKDTTIIA